MKNFVIATVLGSALATSASAYHQYVKPWTQAYQCRFTDADQQKYFAESDLRVTLNFKPAFDAAQAKCEANSAKPATCSVVECHPIAGQTNRNPY